MADCHVVGGTPVKRVRERLLAIHLPGSFAKLIGTQFSAASRRGPIRRILQTVDRLERGRSRLRLGAGRQQQSDARRSIAAPAPESWYFENLDHTTLDRVADEFVRVVPSNYRR